MDGYAAVFEESQLDQAVGFSTQPIGDVVNAILRPAVETGVLPHTDIAGDKHYGNRDPVKHVEKFREVSHTLRTTALAIGKNVSTHVVGPHELMAEHNDSRVTVTIDK